MDFLYQLDIIGPNPRLYIFKRERYKSLLSLFLSLLIILFSIIFILYSLIIYFRYDRPTVTYSKSNDKKELRQIYLKDTILLFQYINHNTFEKVKENIAYYEAEYVVIFDNGTSESLPLDIESCKMGKNINPKYMNYFKERFDLLKYDVNSTDKNIEDFYCINGDKKDISLFYQPNIGFSYINLYFILKNQNEYTPEDIELMLTYENNLINHDNKVSPISEGVSYQFISTFSSEEYSTITLNFQFLKYETDDGLFFDNIQNEYGMYFLDMTYYKSSKLSYNYNNDMKEQNYTTIGTLTFKLNQSNCDSYRRSYKKLQSLLAEVMSIISVLMEVGRIILSFLNEKRMSVDIVRKLFEVDNNRINKSGKFYQNLQNACSDRIKIALEKLNNSFRMMDKTNSSQMISSDAKIQMNAKNEHEIVFKRLNIFYTIKSFICNSNKDKLINLCHDIIIEDMCVENILEKFYSLGKIYKSFLKEESNNLGLNNEPKFRELNSIINTIYNQSYDKNIGNS